MVGFDPHEKIHLSSTAHALAGAVSGAASRALTQPLDVIKIRFQLQVEPLNNTPQSKYKGLVQAFQCIIKEEGTAALWKGHIPAQILSVVYGVAQYSSFEILTKGIWQYLPEALTTTYRPITHTVCGGISGSLATAFIFPIDVIRTRFVAQGEPKLYISLTHAVTSIMRKEGIGGFYRGLIPSLIQIGPQMGFQFGFYSLFTGLWNKSLGILPTRQAESLEAIVCGSGSGALSKLMIYPLDVVKKRLQVQGFEEARKFFGVVRNYNGLIHCVILSIQEEGIRSLFKGLYPSLLKAALVSGINFCVYENVCRLLVLYNAKIDR
ncbi:mitochondrial thiamine pyrophosphate carrier-like isoform X2 [Physella acuta]|uniref:mitochondrial thiamine pyrophosphate carrier-like isoform X2 n=1 Tax=Physella acuta TaxID=109671 RepID=UPI0027DCD164|nr:mitochondrial thiamine pyrophosphate carrier-like isoform X2 [Physella acuta]